MDSGIVCTYYSVDEAIENGAAPVPFSYNKTVDVQCTIDVMDHLLACEVPLSFIIYFFSAVFVSLSPLCFYYFFRGGRGSFTSISIVTPPLEMKLVYCFTK